MTTIAAKPKMHRPSPRTPLYHEAHAPEALLLPPSLALDLLWLKALPIQHVLLPDHHQHNPTSHQVLQEVQGESRTALGLDKLTRAHLYQWRIPALHSLCSTELAVVALHLAAHKVLLAEGSFQSEVDLHRSIQLQISALLKHHPLEAEDLLSREERWYFFFFFFSFLFFFVCAIFVVQSFALR